MKRLTRREFMAVSAAAGATILLPGALSAALDGKKTFTILHTNDMHSAFIGMGPASDYTPFTLNDDTTRGGYARLAALIAQRKAARKDQGPVLVLDAGDYSMGTAFGAATREIGGELQLMSRMGYDATTFGNHEFDSGLTAWASPSVWPRKRAAFRRCSPRIPTSRRATPRWPISSAWPGMG